MVRFFPAVLLLASFSVAAAQPAATRPSGLDRQCIEAVRQFGDTVLRYGTDVYGPQHTPLFVDGLNVRTHEPARWKLDGQEWILSDQANQQNLFRTLDALSRLTGDPKYREAAVSAIRYAFDHLRSDTGLLYWGGHVAYDAGTERIVGELHDKKENGGRYEHELKRHYPYYELMWQVDSRVTKTFLESFWDAHILDWSNLEMNRHGSYTHARGALWASEYKGGPVFFPGRGLSFVNTGSDLFYAAAMLYKLSGDPAPLVWAKRMAHRYVETRNPRTGLGGYQYTRYEKGDRAYKQFGPEFGDRALEGTLLTPEQGMTRYALVGICEMMLGEALGADGKDFGQWAVEDLAAYGRWAYDPANNTFRALLTDGTILTPDDVKRPGYFGPVNSPEFKPMGAGSMFFRAYAMAYRVSGDAVLWRMVRGIAAGNGLGDIGEAPGRSPHLNLQTGCCDPQALYGALELSRSSGGKPYLELAGAIAGNILKTRFRDGLFVNARDQEFAKFDVSEPLALLHYAVAVQDKPGLVPSAWPGKSYFHCYMDGVGRTYDNGSIYSSQSKPSEE
jgi:pectate lyase